MRKFCQSLMESVQGWSCFEKFCQSLMESVQGRPCFEKFRQSLMESVQGGPCFEKFRQSLMESVQGGACFEKFRQSLTESVQGGPCFEKFRQSLTAPHPAVAGQQDQLHSGELGWRHDWCDVLGAAHPVGLFRLRADDKENSLRPVTLPSKNRLVCDRRVMIEFLHR